MNLFRRTLIYIRRYFDFLLLDLVAFTLAYYATVLIRRSLRLPVYHGELFLAFGIVGIVLYFLVLLFCRSLCGILFRSFASETKAVMIQMTITWSLYTVIIFVLKEAHDFSRMIWGLALVVCTLNILLVRTIWKYIVSYSKLRHILVPKLLIVCEADQADTILQRLLPGSFGNQYEICAVVMNERTSPSYHDCYPSETGLSHITDFISDRRVQEAYVELLDAEEEKQVMEELLMAGIVVNRSLRNSRLNYSAQEIRTLSGYSVITIRDTQQSLVSRIDKLLKRLRKKAE